MTSEVQVTATFPLGDDVIADSAKLSNELEAMRQLVASRGGVFNSNIKRKNPTAGVKRGPRRKKVQQDVASPVAGHTWPSEPVANYGPRVA